MASGDENADGAVAAGFAEEAARDGDGPLAWYGDSAYGTGELRAALAAAGHRAVIKPGPLRPAVPGGFTAYRRVIGLPSGARADALAHVQFEVECHLRAQLRHLLKALLEQADEAPVRGRQALPAGRGDLVVEDLLDRPQRFDFE
jgi:hypothetical protein